MRVRLPLRAAGACVLLPCVAGMLAAQDAVSTWSPTRCVRDTLALSASVTEVDTVASGISYRCLFAREGPWAIHVISVDLRNRRYAVDGARALDAMTGREKVSDIARRLSRGGDSVMVAINADFFNLRTGEVLSNTVVRGEWVKGLVVKDSLPGDVDNARIQFALDQNGRPLIGRFELHGAVRAGALSERLLGINNRPPDEGLVLYTPWYGARTPRDSTARGLRELVLHRIDTAGVERRYRIRARGLTSGDTPIPRDGVVLSGTGGASAFLRRVAQQGGIVRVTARLGAHRAAPRTVVGGWGRLIADGVNVAGMADSLEGTGPRFSAARHPRSAIGISRDSTTLLLVVVDGRRPWSVGMSLSELADRMLALGAYQAMNLDGGGSSTLWVRGTIVNYPSDATGERAVGNAVVVKKAARKP